MDERRAKKILGNTIQGGNLVGIGAYALPVFWAPGDKKVRMYGNFTAEELEAVAWWVSDKQRK